MALRKTAVLGKEKYPAATNVIPKNTHQDTMDSFKDEETANNMANDIDELSKPSGFSVKVVILGQD